MKESVFLKQSISRAQYKALKQNLLKELVLALDLRASDFKHYFRVRLSALCLYEKLRKSVRHFKPIKMEVSVNCEEAKTKKIELIIRKLSNDTVFKVSKPLYETVTKQRMLMIISRLFSEQEVRIQYRSTLNL